MFNYQYKIHHRISIPNDRKTHEKKNKPKQTANQMLTYILLFIALVYFKLSIRLFMLFS